MIFFAGYRRWRDRRSAIREIRLIGHKNEEQLVGSQMNPLRQAVQALDAGDKDQASKFWERAKELTPRHAFASLDTVYILLGLGLLDELDTLMIAGHKRSRTNPIYLEGLAQLAQRRERYDEALRWWSKLQKSRPTHEDGWLAGAACLAKLGRNEEAAAILQSATRYLRHGRDEGRRVRLELAHAREALGDWPRALQAWNYVAQTLGLSAGYCGASRVYEQVDDVTRAQQRLGQGLVKHPYDPDLMVASARLEERLGNISSALRYWAELRLSRSQIEIGYSEGIRCLNLAGLVEEASLLRVKAAERFPENSSYAPRTVVGTGDASA